MLFFQGQHTFLGCLGHTRSVQSDTVQRLQRLGLELVLKEGKISKVKDHVWMKLIVDNLTPAEYKKVAFNPVKLFKDRLRTLKSDHTKRELASLELKSPRSLLVGVGKSRIEEELTEPPAMVTEPDLDLIEMEEEEGEAQGEEEAVGVDNEIMEVICDENDLDVFVELISEEPEEVEGEDQNYLEVSEEIVEENEIEDDIQGDRPEPVVINETVHEEVIEKTMGSSFQEEQELLANRFNLTTVKTVLKCPRCNYCLEGVSMF